MAAAGSSGSGSYSARSRRMRRRTVAIVACGVLIGTIAYWLADIPALSLQFAPPDQASTHRWPAASGSPMVVVQPTPTGTHSSVSLVPQRLLLVATRLGRNPREGYADIGVNPNSPQNYRAGAILVNGAKLDEIYADHVVLAREGRREPLYKDTSSVAHEFYHRKLSWAGRGSDRYDIGEELLANGFGYRLVELYRAQRRSEPRIR